MKKIIVISFCLLTLFVSGGLFINQLRYLDIPSNKNDTYAMWQKRKINERTDIDKCKKEILKNEIDLGRQNKRKLSEIAMQTQIFLLGIIILQLLLIVYIGFFFPKNKKLM